MRSRGVAGKTWTRRRPSGASVTGPAKRGLALAGDVAQRVAEQACHPHEGPDAGEELLARFGRAGLEALGGAGVGQPGFLDGHGVGDHPVQQVGPCGRVGLGPRRTRGRRPRSTAWSSADVAGSSARPGVGRRRRGGRCSPRRQRPWVSSVPSRDGCGKRRGGLRAGRVRRRKGVDDVGGRRGVSRIGDLRSCGGPAGTACHGPAACRVSAAGAAVAQPESCRGPWLPACSSSSLDSSSRRRRSSWSPCTGTGPGRHRPARTSSSRGSTRSSTSSSSSRRTAPSTATSGRIPGRTASP